MIRLEVHAQLLVWRQSGLQSDPRVAFDESTASFSLRLQFLHPDSTYTRRRRLPHVCLPRSAGGQLNFRPSEDTPALCSRSVTVPLSPGLDEN